MSKDRQDSINQPAEPQTRHWEPATVDTSDPQELDTVSQWGGSTDAAKLSSPNISVGSQFGDYEILGQIARGGMGVVFKAKQKQANRLVALKMILSGQLADPNEVVRFHQEAEAAANLEHPGIVPIYDVGEVDGQHYFTMALVDGSSLSDQVSEGPISPKHAAELVKSVAQAIAFAHSKGIIHRDLKPANILLDRQQQPRVTDFGLAKRLDAREGLTATGQIMGTPRYMPPEQAMGRGDVGEGADVYSLGAILYELLTGRPPFQAATIHDILVQVIEREPVAIRRLNSAVDLDLETIALKCLQKNVSDRYESAQALVDDLEAYLSSRPIAARPIGRTGRLIRWCRRRPAAAFSVALGAVAVMLAVGLAVGFSYQRELTESLQQQQRLGTELQASILETNAQRKRAQEQEALARRLSYIADINLAHRLWKDNELSRTLAMLDKIGREADAVSPDSAGPGPTESLRGFEWNYLQRLCRPERVVIEFQNTPLDVSLSKDGRFLAVGTDDGVELFAMPDGKSLRTLGTGRAAAQVAFNEQSNMLVASGYAGLTAWSVGDWRQAFVRDDLSLSKASAAPLAWSASGDALAVAIESNYGVAVLDPATGKIRHEIEFKEGYGRIAQLAFDPNDDARINAMFHNRLFGATLHTLVNWNPATGDKKAQRLGKSRVSRVLAATRGATAMTGSNYEVTASIQGEIFRLFGHQGHVNDMEFDEKGERLATGSDDATIIIWNARQAKPLQTLRGHLGAVTKVASSPDLATIASVGRDNTVRIWDGTKDARFHLVRTSNLYNKFVTPKWSADGSQFIGLLQNSFVSMDREGNVEELLAPDGDKSIVSSWSPTRPLSLSAVRGPRPGVPGALDRLPLLVLRDWKTSRNIARFETNDSGAISAFGPRGEQFAIASRDGAIKIYNTANQEVVRTVHGPNIALKRLLFSPQRRWLAGAGEEGVFVCQLLTSDRGEDSQLGGVDASRLLFSDDGNKLAAMGESTLHFWNLQQPKQTRSWELKPYIGVRPWLLNGDGSVLATADRGAVLLCNTSGETSPLKIPTEIQSSELLFTSDQRHLLSAEGPTITMRSLDGQLVRQFTGHTKKITVMELHPDGRRLVSGANDRTVRVWDIATGRETLSLEGHSDRINRISISPDGTRIASTGDHGEIRIWDATPGDWE